MAMRVIGLMMVCAALAGCATITQGTSQSIVINTPGAAGSTCSLTSSAIPSQTVVTPVVLNVEKSQQSIAVRCQKECYQDGFGIVASNMEVMTAGNLVAGGVIGLGVDAASGAMHKYASETNVIMVPVQGCRARA